MIALGVDPGTTVVGYGLVEERNRDLVPIDYGCLKLRSSFSFPQRLQEVYFWLTKIIELHHPDGLVVEEFFLTRNPRAVLFIGQIRGVVLLVAAKAKVEVAEYSPVEVKQAVAGYGRASKDQVQKMVQNLLRLSESPLPEDAADALALAICHLYLHRWHKQLQQFCEKMNFRNKQ